MSQEELITDVCLACSGAIRYQSCPTGGWWIHDVHPDDDHDAEPIHTCIVDSETWDWLQRELNRPPRVIPELVRLFRERSMIVVEVDEGGE